MLTVRARILQQPEDERLRFDLDGLYATGPLGLVLRVSHVLGPSADSGDMAANAGCFVNDQ
jgi:hypothetical protein